MSVFFFCPKFLGLELCSHFSLSLQKRKRSGGSQKGHKEREREREKWEQSSKPKNLGQKKKTLTLNSQALCDKNKERSGLKAPKRGEKWGLSKGPQREREREREKWEQSSKPKNLG